VIFVVSPHLDDAVLSVGEWIYRERAAGVHVITLFAKAPTHGRVTPYDEARGFSSSAHAVRARIAEDDAALAALGATPVRFPYLDGQYIDERTERTTKEIGDRLAAHIDAIGGVLLFPLGLMHPDHALARNVALWALAASYERISRAFAYEELPARVLWPELVPAQVAALGAGLDVTPELVAPASEVGTRNMKRVAMHHYRSQFDDLNDPSFYVPERMWRVR